MPRHWGLSAMLAVALTAEYSHAQSPELKPALVVLPDPTGPFAVGKTLWHWPDPVRPDSFTDAPDDVRELVVQGWYPAAASEPAARTDELAYYALTSRAY